MNKSVLALSILVFFFVIYVFLKLFWFQNIEVELVEQVWNYEQQIENYAPRQYSEFTSDVPENAYDISKSNLMTVVFYRNAGCVFVGKALWLCDYANYTIDEWRYQYSTHTEGKSITDARYFAEPEDLNVCEVLVNNKNCQRKGTQIEHYYLVFDVPDIKSLVYCPVNFEQWSNQTIGKIYRGKLNVLDRWLDCNAFDFAN